MPLCLQCAREIDRPDALCPECGEVASASDPLDVVTAHDPIPAVAEPEPVVAPVPAPAVTNETAPASEGAEWRPWYLAAAVAAAVGAVGTYALLGTAPALPDEARAPVETSVAGVALPRAPRVVSGGPPKWSDTNRTRWISNHPRSVAFQLEAENTVAVWMRRVRPVLVVRCLANRTEAFVWTQSAAAIEPQPNTYTVRVGFDDESDSTQRWPGSAEYDALFVPDGRAFVKRLARAETLRVGFTPHNAAPTVAEFDVRGFDAHLAAIARTCRWK